MKTTGNSKKQQEEAKNKKVTELHFSLYPNFRGLESIIKNFEAFAESPLINMV